MRVAAVQLGIPVQSYTRDLLNGLASQGAEVALVTRPDDWPGYVDPGSLRGRVHLVETARHWRALRELRYGVVQALGIPTTISPAHTLAQARRFLDAEPPFDVVIGIEKGGLEIAAHFARRSGVPFVYYNLELYIEDHPEYPRFHWKRRSEIESHRRAAATIIQDRARWDVLREANRPASERVFFFPVGVPRRDTPPPAAPERPYTVLYLGMIRPTRFADELIEAGGRLPEGTRLRLHGPIFPPYARTLEGRRLPPQVTVTWNMLDERAVHDLVDRAAVGLALYRRDYANDRLTAYSSQKLAMYLRAGVPLVTFASESYRDLFSRHRCGVMIDSFEELPGAVAKILERREEYSRAALQAFDEIYDIDRYWKPLAEFLAELRR